MTKKIKELNLYSKTYEKSTATYYLLSWENNPYNIYRITTKTPAMTTPEVSESMKYFTINVNITITGKQREAGVVTFDYENQFTYDGEFGFDIYDEKTLDVFKNEYKIRDFLELAYLKETGKPNIEDNKRVIFLINNRELSGKSIAFASDPELDKTDKGYSIFIFKKALTDWRTIVHELGHTFGLNHPFEMNPSFRQGSSNNFMDYDNIDKMFWKWQWKQINKTDFNE